MAVPTRDNLKVESTIVGEVVPMTMSTDAADQVSLTSMAIDMYSDRIMAPLREIATNAWDAHIMAEIDDPIEVNLPGSLSPSLVIRDYGEGLSAEDLKTLFAQYGRSLKRKHTEATGMLGIGAKSPLTYAQQFTVVSIHDSQRTTVSIARTEEGGSEMTVLATEPTADRSGTEVQIPVARGDSQKFTDRAHHLFRFWPKGSVLVNGREPDMIWDTAYEVKPGELYVIEDEPDNAIDDKPSDYVVMGRIPYPADFGIYDKARSYYNTKVRAVVAFVEPSAVHHTPAREELSDTTRTKARIEKIKTDFRAAAAKKIEETVSKAATKPEAFTAYWEGVHKLDLNKPGIRPTVKFKGEAVPETIKYPESSDDGTDDSQRRSSRPFWRRNSDDTAPHQFRILPLQKATYGRKNDNDVKDALKPKDFDAPLIFVTNFFPTSFNADQRRRLDAYREFKKQDDHRMILVKQDKLPMPEWIDNAETWDWKDVRKWRDPNAPKPASGTARTAGTYSVLKPGENYQEDVDANKLPAKNLYWVEGGKYAGRSQRDKLATHNPKAWLVVLPQNRIDKFKRLYPHAVNYMEAITSAALLAWDALSEEAKALYLWETPRIFEGLLAGQSADEIDDPELSLALEWAAKQRTYDKKYEQLDARYAEYFVAPKMQIKTIDQDVIRKRYPLLREMHSYGAPNPTVRRAIRLYLNAAYADKEDT